ncbi:protein draper-like [Mizuhopecten yessoensis]|uniref:protein draper-like n=1 Tax=Mizuhopecten yessoensis TaxID=6573 RepID=UPI000B45BE61|nr:protein draper-like [Mizuhopecten yessoensis]
MTALQKSGPGSNDPSLAVDGNTSTCSRTKANSSDNGSSLYNWQILVGNSPGLLSMHRCTVLKVHGHRLTSVCDGTPDRQIRTRYVVVLNTHAPVVVCEFKILTCAQFRFGEDCEQSCLCHDLEEECDLMDGSCRSGCRDGRWGQGCQLECVESYGPGCMYQCGHCANMTSCDPVTGMCLTSDCDPGWRGPKCDIQCQPGYYGLDCTSICGHCRHGVTCDPRDGRCDGGCAPGWAGDQCDQRCQADRHGENCLFACGACRNRCDPVTGLCPSGCAPGWQGRFCTIECLPGTYGPDCEAKCPQCWELVCDKETGECQQGCQQGLRGQHCNSSCPVGSYGRECAGRCGRCLAQEVCSVTDGACPGGCEPGYNGTQCHNVCDPGYYGEGCMACGFCTAQLPCDLLTGKCPAGCVMGFDGDRCDTAKAFVESSNNYLDYVLPLNFILVGGVLTFVFACLIVKSRREELYPYSHTRLPE